MLGFLLFWVFFGIFSRSMLIQVTETSTKSRFFHSQNKNQLSPQAPPLALKYLQHKYIKARQSGKAPKCRCGIRVALLMPADGRSEQNISLPPEQHRKGGWLYRKHLRVKTASSNGWGIKLKPVHQGRAGARCFCRKHHCKKYWAESAPV